MNGSAIDHVELVGSIQQSALQHSVNIDATQGPFHRFPSQLVLIGQVLLTFSLEAVQRDHISIIDRLNSRLVTVLCSAQALARGHRRRQLLAQTNPQIMCTLSAAPPVSLTIPSREPKLRN